MLKTRTILIFFSVSFVGMALAGLAPRPHPNQELIDQRFPAQVLLVGDEKPIYFWNKDPNGDWWYFSIRASGVMDNNQPYIWPPADGDPNAILCTDGNGTLFWGPFDANAIVWDGNDFTLPDKTPWNVMYVGSDGYPLTEDPNDFTYYQPETAFGIGLDNIAEGTYANNYIQVYSLLDFEPNLLNVSIGMGADDTATGPNNVRIGQGAGPSLDEGYENTLGGKDAGLYVVDSNDNTAWGYKALGGDATIGVADYPVLRTTTNQADPGLTHTTAISNVTELQNMNNDKAGNYYLTGDIDASATATWNGGAGFDPIGTAVSPFTGTLDGDGYTISNLTVNRGTEQYNGLFGSLRGTAKVANLNITNATIVSDDYGAVLAGYCDTIDSSEPLIQNCTVSGTVTSRTGETTSSLHAGLVAWVQGEQTQSAHVYIYDCSSAVTIDTTPTTGTSGRAGGFVAFTANMVTISNCYATGNVTAGIDQDKHWTGGFVGQISSQTYISYCYATGTVSGNNECGGFAGGTWANNDGSYIRRSYSTGNVTGAGTGADEVGGFIGENRITITDCYATGNATLSGATGECGGFIGLDGVPGSPVITNCYSIGAVTGGDTTGGFLGGLGSGTYNTSYWDTETSGQATSAAGTGKTTTWLKTKANYPSAWDFDTIWSMEAGPNIQRGAAFGAYAGGKAKGGSDDSLYLGTYAGSRNETDPNRFFLDNLDRSTYLAEKEHGMMYGYFADDPNDQWLNLNIGELNLDFGRFDVNDVNVAGNIIMTGLTASRLVDTDASKNLASVTNLQDYIAGTANQITVTDDSDGTVTLSTPQDIDPNADVSFNSIDVNSADISANITTSIADTQVVYSNAGVLAGHADMTWDDSNRILDVNAVDVNDVAILKPDSAVFQPNADSTTFLQFKDQAGNVDFNYDSTNGRVGIGTATPSTLFDVQGNSSTQAIATIVQNAAWNGGTNNYALSVTGYTNLGGCRINIADGANAFYGGANQMGFSVNDGQLITFGNYPSYIDSLKILDGGLYFRVPIYRAQTPSTATSTLDVRGTVQIQSNLAGSFEAPSAGEGFELGYDSDGQAGSESGGSGASIFQSYRRDATAGWRDIWFRGNNIQFDVNGNMIMYWKTDGSVGIGESAPETQLEMTGAAPYITLHNSTHEDADGGRESRINFKGEQTGEEESTLARDEASHDGSADDQKGQRIWYTNDGADGDSPTEGMRLGRSGLSTANDPNTLGVGVTTFMVESNVMTMTGDGAGNTIGTITGAKSGTLLTMIFVDALITITDTDAHTANTVDLAGTATNFTSADDTVLQIVYNGVSWYEISRSVN